MRKNLNYDWQFIDDFNPEYLKAKSIAGSRKINLPHSVKEMSLNYFDESDYQGVYTYIKLFRLSISDLQKCVLLTFEGVMSQCEVYINGQKAGEHQGGYTAFTLNITRFVTFDKDNVLLVKVDSNEDKDIPPFGNIIDYLTYGGIYREVYLDVKDQEHFTDVLVSPVDNKDLQIQYKLRRLVDIFKIKYVIKDQEGNSVFTHETDIVQNADSLTCSQPLDNPHLWDLDDPYLYTLESELIIDKQVVDTNITRFGVRQAKFTPDGFYLNGRRVQLRGLNRHQSYPLVGYAMPKSQQRLDALILKEDLHCNIVRSSHYPQSRHFYDCCDEIGLLAFIEIPGWQHLGDSVWQANLLKSTEEMVLQNFNHPSIVIYGSRVDESVDNHDLYTATYQMIRKYDQYRAIGGVRNFAGSELLEDVYTYNDFVHNGTNKGVMNPKKVCKNRVPYLITEHNGHMYPTKSFDNEERRVSQALRHARVINDAMEYPQISGVIGWCFADYNTHKQFGSGDRICYHGVMDSYRNSKYAADIYRSQTSDVPFMKVLSNLAAGDYDQMLFKPLIIAANVDYIYVYKGEELIAKILPDRQHYQYLPHPLFVMNDLIGDQMTKQEGFSSDDGEIIKGLIHQIVSQGFDSLKFTQKAKMLSLLKKYNMKVEDGSRLFATYFQMYGYGDQPDYYRFVGYLKEQPVIEQKVGIAHNFTYRFNISQADLVEEGTYDVMKIDIAKVDQYGNVLFYANDVIKVATVGAIGIIGPTSIALSGGVASFYVKSHGLKSNDCLIKITVNDILIQEIKTNVVLKEG